MSVGLARQAGQRSWAGTRLRWRVDLALEDARATLGNWLATEWQRGRGFLAVPVAFGTGILIYFAAPDEPLALVVAGVALMLGLAAFAARSRLALFMPLACLALVSAGFAAGAIRTQWLGHAILSAETATVTVTGHVASVERRENGDRLTIKVAAIEPAPREKPARIRVTTRATTPAAAGAGVRFRARLRPPAEPASPLSHDFARDAFYLGLGATGFVLGAVEIVDIGPASFAIRAGAELDRIRNAIGERIRRAVPGENGAIVTALVTGKRDGITEDLNAVMRAAGTYHLLSISGFHMALVAAIVFAVVRGSLALVPVLALTQPVKSWAALIALAVSTAYLVLSGAEVATQRSWIMIAIVLVGIAIGRAALTLRTLALAALAVLILQPESLLGPSFQMSFAATLSLVAGYGAIRPWSERHIGSGIGRAAHAVTHGVIGLALSSFIASLTTAPFAAYHFHTLQTYAIPGNMIAAPIVEFLTMPLSILALIAWPFGLDGPVWALAGWSIDIFVRACRWVASWPGGTHSVPAFGTLAIGLATIGLLLAACLSTPLRLAGVPFILCGLALMPMSGEKPLVLIDAEGSQIAVRAPDGRYRILSQRPNPFITGQWLAADADNRSPRDRAALTAGILCDGIGCTAPLLGGGRLALATTPEALADDCREARIVATRMAPSRACRAALIRLDALPHTGSIALHIRDGRFVAETARKDRHSRPWHRAKPARPPPILVTQSERDRSPATAGAPAIAPPFETEAETEPDQ